MGSPESPVNTTASGVKQGRKRSRGGHCDLPTFAHLQAWFHLPAAKACAELGIGLVSLKRACRQFGLLRWPYRKPRSGNQGLASDSSSDSEASGKGLHLPTTYLGPPSDASCHEVVKPLPQRDTCVLASALPGPAQLASPSRSAPGNCPPPQRPSSGGRVPAQQQQGAAGFQSFPAAPLPLPDLERLCTMAPLDAAPLLSQLLQYGLEGRAQPACNGWQPHLPASPLLGPYHPTPSPPLPGGQAGPPPSAIDTAALWQLARQLVEVPGLAGELAAAIGMVVLERQGLKASG